LGWLRLVGFLKSQVSLANEPYKRDDILPKRPIILRRLPIEATSPPHTYTTADTIDESMHQLDQLLQDVQECRSERDQRDEFQDNDDHVALVTLDS